MLGIESLGSHVCLFTNLMVPANSYVGKQSESLRLELLFPVRFLHKVGQSEHDLRC